MNVTSIILFIVLIINIVAPFAVYYAIKLAREKDYKTHRKIQNVVFALCIMAVLALEGLIRFSGGSGSLAEDSSYAGTPFFRNLFIAHIVGAVLIYILWIFQVVVSNRKFKRNTLFIKNSSHKTVGHILFFGLIYIAITALMIYIMILL